MFKNLSRLASQWEGMVNAMLANMEKEALRRLDNFIQTIEGLLASVPNQTEQIRTDVRRVEESITVRRPEQKMTPESSEP